MKIVKCLSLIFLLALLFFAACDLLNPAIVTDDPVTEDPITEEERPFKILTVAFESPRTTVESEFNTIFNGIFNSFKTAYPDLDVEVETVAVSEYPDRLNHLITSNQLPDVIAVWPKENPVDSSSSQLYENNLLLDLSSRLDLTQIKPAAKRPQGSNGEIYFIPQEILPTSILYANQTLLNQLSLSTPSSYQDIVNMVPAITAAGKVPISLGAADQWTVNSCLLSTLVCRLGGPYWISNAIAGTKSFNDAPFVDALSLLEDMYTTDGVIPDHELNYNQAVSQFINGDSVFLLNGSWGLDQLDTEMTDNIVLLNFPTLLGETYSNSSPVNYSQGYGITTKASESEKFLNAAIDFMNLYTGETGTYLALASGLIPPGIADSYLSSLNPNITKTDQWTAQLMSDGDIIDNNLPGIINSNLNSQLESLRLGTTTPNQIGEYMNMIMDAYNNPQIPDGQPSIPTAENMIVNGDFSADGTYWECISMIDGNTFTINDGIGQITTSTAGSRWETETKYVGPRLPLEYGNWYEVSFDAWGNNRDVYFAIQEDKRDLNNDGLEYTYYVNEQIQVQTTSNRFTYIFNMDHPTDDQFRLTFHSAAGLGDIYIDNIVLKPLNEIGNPLVNMVVNGDFTMGDRFWGYWVNTDVINPETDISSSIDEAGATIYLGNTGDNQGNMGLTYGYESVLLFEQDCYYEVSFDVSADNGGWLTFNLAEDGVDYNGDGNTYTRYYDSGQVYMTPSAQTIKKSFLMNQITGPGRLDILIGGNNNTTMVLNNLIIKQIPAPLFNVSENMLYDGGNFSDGLNGWNMIIYDSLLRNSLSMDTAGNNVSINMNPGLDDQGFDLKYGYGFPITFTQGAWYRMGFSLQGEGNYLDKDFYITFETRADINPMEVFRPFYSTLTNDFYELSFYMAEPTQEIIAGFHLFSVLDGSAIIDSVVLQQIDDPGNSRNGTYAGASLFVESTTGDVPGTSAGDWVIIVNGTDIESISNGNTYYGYMDKLTGWFNIEAENVDDGYGGTYSFRTTGEVAEDGSITGYWHVDFSSGGYQSGTMSGAKQP